MTGAESPRRRRADLIHQLVAETTMMSTITKEPTIVTSFVVLKVHPFIRSIGVGTAKESQP
jgi:hypothetical protein